MTSSHRTRQRRALWGSALWVAASIAAILVVMLIAAGCSSDDQTGTPPNTAHQHDEDYSGTPGLADAAAPTGVLNTALTTIFSWEPVTDTSPTDALQRSAPQLTGAAAASARDGNRAQIRTSVEWTAWHDAGDLITARVEGAQATLLNPDKAVGRATVTQTVLHLDGGSTPYQRFTAAAELVRTADGWKLATYPTITNTTTG